MLCKFDQLRLAIAVIETAGHYLAKTKKILFVPMFYLIITILFIASMIGALYGLISLGGITDVNVQSQSKSIDLDDN